MRAVGAVALLVTAAVLALAGCGDSEPEAGGPPISYSLTGGLAGVERRLEISGGNEVEVSTAGAPLQPVEVDPELIAAARAELEAVDLDVAPGVPGDGPVPDDLGFELAYGDQRVSGTEATLPSDSPLRPAIGAVEAVLRAASAAREAG